MGKPDENAVEFSKDFLAEIVRASGEQAYPRFEFLDGLFANGNPAFGHVKAEKVETFEEGNDLRLLRGQRKPQVGAEESIHKVQSLFSRSV